MFIKYTLGVAGVFWSSFALLLEAPNAFTLVAFIAAVSYLVLDGYKRDKEWGMGTVLAILGSSIILLIVTIFVCALFYVILYGGKPEPKRRLPPPAPMQCKVLVHTDAGISSKEPGWCEWSDIRSLSEGLNKASGRVMIIAHGRRENHYVVGEGWTTPRWVVGGVDARAISENVDLRGLEMGIMACRGEKNPTGLDRLRVHPLWEEKLGVWVWAREGEKVLVDEGTLEKSVDFFLYR